MFQPNSRPKTINMEEIMNTRPNHATTVAPRGLGVNHATAVAR
jgi:hypothetical protein